MIFEKAIEDASTMFLFDRRSQQQLQEMAEASAPGSKDRFLSRLSLAAFVYYNDFETQGWDIRNSIRQAQLILQEVKNYKEDRIFYILALRLEVDILLHNSRLKYLEASKLEKQRCLCNEEDERALSICISLLRNFPENLSPIPNAWYTSLLPLVPNFKDEVLLFYKDRLKENRVKVLQKVLIKLKKELMVAVGIVEAKRFLSQTASDLSGSPYMKSVLLSNIRNVIAQMEEDTLVAPRIVSDMNIPKGVTRGQLEIAQKYMQKETVQAYMELDLRKYTTARLKQGVLCFLRNQPEDTIESLVFTLRASQTLDAESRKSRQYRHELFPDIPFMIGTSFLKLDFEARKTGKYKDKGYLKKSAQALRRAICLYPKYHYAYVNLLTATYLDGDPDQDALIQMYLDHVDRDITQIDSHLFRNLATLEFQTKKSVFDEEVVKWLLVSCFSMGGQLTKGLQVLEDLKTLYILNAHEISCNYLGFYRSVLRQNDTEFIKDMENDTIHSTVLFYIAHAFAMRAMTRPDDKEEMKMEYDLLYQSIELNTDALFFDIKNSAALRLVETQKSILQFALQRAEKRWEQISTNLSNRFAYYEDSLMASKCWNHLRERLESVRLGELAPEQKFSETVISRMESALTSEQKERINNRVHALNPPS